MRMYNVISLLFTDFINNKVIATCILFIYKILSAAIISLEYSASIVWMIMCWKEHRRKMPRSN
jgi:hypothetical protein